MTPRRILLIGNFPPPFGGVPTHLRQLSEHLRTHDWDVHVLAMKTEFRGVQRVAPSLTVYGVSKPLLLSGLLDPRNRVPRAETARRSYPDLRRFLGALALSMLAKRIVVENRVRVLSAYHVLGPGLVGAYLAEQLGVPLITTVFGELYADYARHCERIDDVRYVAQHTAKWLSCSAHCARSVELLNLGVDVEPLLYGVDTTEYHPDRDGTEVRRRLGIAPDGPVAIFVGRMVEEMGLGVLLRAIPRVLRLEPRLHFLIAGARQVLTATAEDVQREFPRNVSVVCDVPQADLPSFYAAGDVAVAPSTNARACLGLALAEAGACGKPVVGCDVGGTREVVVEGETGLLVKPDDPTALGDAILELTRDEAAAKRMGTAGRARVCALFDQARTHRRFVEILEDVLGH